MNKENWNLTHIGFFPVVVCMLGPLHTSELGLCNPDFLQTPMNAARTNRQNCIAWTESHGFVDFVISVCVRRWCSFYQSLALCDNCSCICNTPSYKWCHFYFFSALPTVNYALGNTNSARGRIYLTGVIFSVMAPKSLVAHFFFVVFFVLRLPLDIKFHFNHGHSVCGSFSRNSASTLQSCHSSHSVQSHSFRSHENIKRAGHFSDKLFRHEYIWHNVAMTSVDSNAFFCALDAKNATTWPNRTARSRYVTMCKFYRDRRALQYELSTATRI